ncbi:MAG: radical SAM protein [Acidimicrobiia bacterium]|nr:radical SAM protein [Acidimicrobiia bacterium]
MGEKARLGPGRASRLRNEFWREFGYHHGHVRVRNRPSVFALESTNLCNLRCVMCPRGEPDVMDRSLGSMSDEVLDRILDEARFFDDPCYFHWFGEPLLHPRLFEQIERAKSRGVPNLAISTNATLLDADRARSILESRLDTLVISIDGATKEVYERVRLSGLHEYEQVVENARRFLAARRAMAIARPRTILSIIVMDETEPDLVEFRRLWERAGADEVQFKPFHTWASQVDGVIELATAADRARASIPRRNPCRFLWESVVIAWNGLVVPCCNDYDAKEVLGDLKVQSLDEIWNGERIQRLRRDELAGCNDSTLCAGCTQAPGHTRQRLWPIRR